MGILLPFRDQGNYYLWKYVPSLPAAIILIVLFIVMTGLHLWKQIKTKTKFCIPFTIGVFFEFIGYIGRAKANAHTDRLMPYILQSFFTLVAPALFAASIYMTLGRIMRSIHAEHHSIIRASRLTKIFVIGDILAFFIQGGSSGLLFNTSTANIGEKIVLFGLLVQIVSFGIFFICTIIWHSRLRKAPTPESFTADSPWLQTLWMLYVVSFAIFARSIFRCVEYAQGQSGYPMGHEWCMYIFDAVPMFLVTVAFFIYYPSRLVYSSTYVAGEEQGVHMDSQILAGGAKPRHY